METVFWLVWEAGSGYTRFRHESEIGAIAEAKRLARQEGGKRFYVLKALSHYEVNNLQETILLEPSTDIPF